MPNMAVVLFQAKDGIYTKRLLPFFKKKLPSQYILIINKVTFAITQRVLLEHHYF